MNLLLDTHIWIWYLTANSRLSQNLVQVIEDENNQLYLSPISIWETLLLGEKKRIILKPNPEDWVKDSLDELYVIEVPLSNEIAIMSRQLDLIHQDPADRFIVATALHYDLILATIDKNLVQASWLRTIS
jgi:PIN domain nuclease of toxin-antitoxin system